MDKHVDLAIRRMLTLGVPKAAWRHVVVCNSAQEFIAIVILVFYLEVPAWEEDKSPLDLVELFSGKARISRLASWVGLASRAYDIEYHPRKHPSEPKRGKLRHGCMDVNGDAGLALLHPKAWIDLRAGLVFWEVALAEAGHRPLPPCKAWRSFVRCCSGVFKLECCERWLWQGHPDTLWR